MKNIQEFTEFMVSNGFISKEQMDEATAHAVQKKETLEEVLVEKGFITDPHLGQLIANFNNWRFISLAGKPVETSVLKIIPESVARKQKILAFKKDDDGVHIAFNNPTDVTLINMLHKRFGAKVVPHFATHIDISQHYKLYKSDISEEFTRIIHGTAQEKESKTINIVNMLLTRGYESSTSDIHIEPHEEETVIRYRIDGAMQDVMTIPRNLHDFLISRIKIMSHLRTDEHQVPQDGKLRHELHGEKVDVRVSVVPTTKGENVVMRLLSEKNKQYSLSDLGLSDKDFVKLSEAIKKPWGMILSTGPTGSGKTTSLYAILKILNKKDVNIATIEDPVEYNINGITQIQVNKKTGLTFGSGLKSLVRQDPDIVMVGEIRDKETADIAVNSAMTGHLVLSTLHTNDAATTLPRLLDMDVEPFLVASTINIAIGQRLVRKICTNCIQSHTVTHEELKQRLPIDIIEKVLNGKDSVELYEGKGCNLCNHSGYHGRTGVFEILEIDDDIKKMIMENSDADDIKAKAVEKGMTTMFDDARDKVLNGIITIDELLRVVKV